jgi:hypothetical protein
MRYPLRDLTVIVDKHIPKHKKLGVFIRTCSLCSSLWSIIEAADRWARKEALQGRWQK